MIRRAASCLAAFPAAALAAQSIDSPPAVRVNPTEMMRSAYDGAQTVAVMRRSARCIVSRARRASENLIFTVPDTDAEWRLLYGPIASRLDQCAFMGVYVSNALLRGAIAEALYESAFRSPRPLSPGAAVASLRWPERHRSAASLAPIYEFGRCVVADDPEQVRQLLATEPFSAEERRKLDALGPRLQPCLVRGTTFSTNRATLRAILAESLYRWAVAQRGGSG